MVPAQKVQQAMHGQQTQFGLFRISMLTCLADNHRPGDGEISDVSAGPFE